MNPSLDLLRTLLGFLEKLSSDEIKRLAAGRAELRLVPVSRPPQPDQRASKPLSKADLAKLRQKIEKQKAGAKRSDLNWLNKYSKDDLWRLIRSYKFPPDSPAPLAPSTPKRAMIAFLQLKALGQEPNKSSIGEINLATDWN